MVICFGLVVQFTPVVRQVYWDGDRIVDGYINMLIQQISKQTR